MSHSTHQVLKDSYRVGPEIGRGSFANVYKAQHIQTRTPVAIKSVQLSRLNKKLLENLDHEIAILKKMKHPHIVSLLDTYKNPSYFYLIMEYCSLGDLSFFSRKRKEISESLPLINSMFQRYPPTPNGGLHEDVASHFLKQLASALEFLRKNQLIHRDIKPQNLLLCPPHKSESLAIEAGIKGLWELPVLKLADFGFARILPASTMADTLCGSPLYMAPEILRLERYTAKADLWSVGAVLYEMVSGKPPFKASNHVELLSIIEQTNNAIRFPDSTKISAKMTALIKALLKKDPTERMSFAEFFNDPIIKVEIVTISKPLDQSYLDENLYISEYIQLGPTHPRNIQQVQDARNAATARRTSAQKPKTVSATPPSDNFNSPPTNKNMEIHAHSSSRPSFIKPNPSTKHDHFKHEHFKHETFKHEHFQTSNNPQPPSPPQSAPKNNNIQYLDRPSSLSLSSPSSSSVSSLSSSSSSSPSSSSFQSSSWVADAPQPHNHKQKKTNKLNTNDALNTARGEIFSQSAKDTNYNNNKNKTDITNKIKTNNISNTINANNANDSIASITSNSSSQFTITHDDPFARPFDSESEYVVVEKRTVEVNYFADELAHPVDSNSNNKYNVNNNSNKNILARGSRPSSGYSGLTDYDGNDPNTSSQQQKEYYQNQYHQYTQQQGQRRNSASKSAGSNQNNNTSIDSSNLNIGKGATGYRSRNGSASSDSPQSNNFAGTTTSTSSSTVTKSTTGPEPISVAARPVRRNSIIYGSSPSNALARALQMATARIRGKPSNYNENVEGYLTSGPSNIYQHQRRISVTTSGSSPGNGAVGGSATTGLNRIVVIDDADEQMLLKKLDNLQSKAKVLILFAEVKYQQMAPRPQTNANGRKYSSQGREKEEEAQHNEEGFFELENEAMVLVATEAFVLYYKSLAILDKFMKIASKWWKSRCEMAAAMANHSTASVNFSASSPNSANISTSAAGSQGKHTSFAFSSTSPTSPTSLASRLSGPINVVASDKLVDLVQWAREQFNECLSRADYAQSQINKYNKVTKNNKLNNKHYKTDSNYSNDYSNEYDYSDSNDPANAATNTTTTGTLLNTKGMAERLIFDRALEMSKSAAKLEKIEYPAVVGGSLGLSSSGVGVNSEGGIKGGEGAGAVAVTGGSSLSPEAISNALGTLLQNVIDLEDCMMSYSTAIWMFESLLENTEEEENDQDTNRGVTTSSTRCSKYCTDDCSNNNISVALDTPDRERVIKAIESVSQRLNMVKKKLAVLASQQHQYQQLQQLQQKQERLEQQQREKLQQQEKQEKEQKEKEQAELKQKEEDEDLKKQQQEEDLKEQQPELENSVNDDHLEVYNSQTLKNSTTTTFDATNETTANETTTTTTSEAAVEKEVEEEDEQQQNEDLPVYDKSRYPTLSIFDCYNP